MNNRLTENELEAVSGGWISSSSQTIRKIESDKGTLTIIETQGGFKGNFTSTAIWYPMPV